MNESGPQSIDAVSAEAQASAQAYHLLAALLLCCLAGSVTACSNCRHMLEDNNMHMELIGITELIAENLDTKKSARG